MKLHNKIALAVVAAGSLAGVMAESITFGVEIPPIASLSVRDGVIYSPGALANNNTVAPVANTNEIVVGGFSVQCNMPKWNIYFTLRNDGYLMSKNGTHLKNKAGSYLPLSGTAAAAIAANAGQLFLKFPLAASQIKAQDEAGTPLLVSATSAITDVVISNATAENTLAAALDNAASNTCTTAACTFANGWLLATDETNAIINLATSIDEGATPATTGIAGVAGTYTETLYLTLVSAY